ncbi:hypothetical protein C9374_010402 [Naegleria lovaniensis]|uniref:Nudix hydrolase domain-containing protein n=1 Tax=Naegleria lovaniensis TaxID=51637 RepID=A0AA88KDM1_NAELO|nr:uncharacterized protein C9374_010402 [Naegleria lovaniensis]KAG2374825.1 hypothetical protein C9374_010402 [Naegleria lovaniensis]
MYQYGIVPWVEINKSWYCLLQVSFSSYELDVKLDPLRGTMKPNETPVQTAIREAKEESFNVLDFSNVEHILARQKPVLGLYHVQLLFDYENAIQDILLAFDHQQKDKKEVDGLMLFTQEKGPPKGVRISSQVESMLQNIPAKIPVKMKKRQNLTCVSFVAEPVSDPATSCTTVIVKHYFTKFVHRLQKEEGFRKKFIQQMIVQKLIDYPQDLDAVREKLKDDRDSFRVIKKKWKRMKKMMTKK